MFTFSAKQKRLLLYGIILLCRYSFTAGCAGMVGGAIAFKMVHAQGFGHVADDPALEAYKVQALQLTISQLQSNIDSLGHVVNLQENEIAKMEGIGIGLGTVLAILQVLQAFLGRRLNPNSHE